MPYFQNQTTNILFIHIPKTGGVSIESYFSKKYNIPLIASSIYEFLPPYQMQQLQITSSLQHLTYQQIMANKDFFNIQLNNLTTIAIIRNPYERIISSLCFQSKISNTPTQNEVFTALKDFINNPNTDNHNLPQYKFITDENQQLIPSIIILKTDTLTADMHKLGFTDFNIKINTNRFGITDYMSLLNNDSINLINEHYNDDFEILNFTKIINT